MWAGGVKILFQILFQAILLLLTDARYNHHQLSPGSAFTTIPDTLLYGLTKYNTGYTSSSRHVWQQAPSGSR